MSKILKYRKIIMISLILVAVIVCVCATYITEYNAKKVKTEDMFAISTTRTYADEDKFLDNFSSFEVYTVSVEGAYYDEGTLKTGTYKFAFKSSKKTESNIDKTISITIGLGANWIGYTSTTTNRSHTIGESTTFTLSSINQVFPAKGKLWFTKVKQPTLYVYIEWDEIIDDEEKLYYTLLEYDYKEYSQREK